MSLNTESKKCNIIINLPLNASQEYEKAFSSNLKKWCDQNTKEYYFIKHDLDVNNDTGMLKTLHYHLLFECAKKHRFKYYINQLSRYLYLQPFNIQVMKWISYENDIQYLIHKNEKNKYPYDISSIVTNVSNADLQLIIDREPQKVIEFDSLIECINRNKGSLIKIYKELGFENVKKYRAIIQDLIHACRW